MPPDTPTFRSRRARLLHGIAALLLVPVLLFEEWGWAPLAALTARLARLPWWARAESWVRNLPPWGALLAFVLPVLLLLPVKVLALFLFSEGHATSGVTVLIVAKLVGTAIVARIFQLVETTLMRIPLFARWYPRWKAWKNSVLYTVRESALWRSIRAMKQGARRWWRRVRNA
ncbi:hypothetical protein [Variovorax sp. N23]|uniref:hypothetical protein n=1 Tax=Variovorax sp. N23 TaxID=2980555 RepID=UPI0021C817F5|nr:hypothetical protein [Variovorax sp. N23]MCU4118578.1 hypothetical protein [Variovorax sp. N23]